MASSPKRNSLIDRIYRFLTDWRKPKNVSGSQRSANVMAAQGIRKRNYDLEIRDFPIRDRIIAQELINLWNYGYIPRHVLSYAARDVFSSLDGNNRGWGIAATVDEDGLIPIDLEVLDILKRIRSRKNGDAYVIGGNRFKPGVREALGFGDSFWQMAIQREGNGSNLYEISRTIKMPTWEMFRVEDNFGSLMRFEQRRFIRETQPFATFNPAQIIHFRYEPRHLYGISIFHQSLEPRADRVEVRRDMALASRASAIVMKTHEFPEGWSVEQRSAYKADYNSLLAEGAISDMFLHDGVKISEISDRNPAVSPLLAQDKHLKYEEIPPGFPVWLFPGLVEKGAREISTQPTLAYLRMRNDWCAMMTEGIRWACDIELVLKLGFTRYTELKQQYGEIYRIVWPEWPVNAEDAKAQLENRKKTDDDEDEDEVDAFMHTLRQYKLSSLKN